MPNPIQRVFIAGILLSLFLAACQDQATPTPLPISPTPLPSVNTPVPATPSATLPPKPSEPPARSLVICLGQEPTSLYVYGASSRGMWSVLEAIYDGPIDTRQPGDQPVILQKLPSFADQDAVFEPVEVKAGDLVVNADGNPVNLAAGTRVLPSGCMGPDCAQTWDGQKALKMDRLKVTYKLLPGLKWSDGAPLTSADSVYSFNLAADPATQVSKRIVDLTASYQALDELTVEWSGVPGFSPPSLDALFFQPLPQHAWDKYKAADLATTDEVARKPLGWGPYQIDSWTAGDNIRLSKNPNYFRASDGLPKFDTLVFRFLGEPADNSLTAVQAGECDLVDQSSLAEDQLQSIEQLVAQKTVKAYVGLGPEWEALDFGIRPASYDDGYQPANDRPDFFGDVRVRQAFAYCIDRQAIVDQLLGGLSSVPSSYLPPISPWSSEGFTRLSYDLEKGKQLLDEAGWKVGGGDASVDPSTRTAQGVPGVPNGTAFIVQYYTTQATLRVETAQLIAKNLADCGVAVKVNTLDPGNLYAAGPDGVLFGRHFDLAQFSWESSSQPPCSLYETSAIPNEKNNWLGGNLTGYGNSDYDAACRQARLARLDSTGITAAYEDTASLLAQDLPMIPLYYAIHVAISRADFCNVAMDRSTRSFLWNLESYDINPACRP